MTDDDEVIGLRDEIASRPSGQELGVAGQRLGTTAGLGGRLGQKRPVEVLGQGPGQGADGRGGGVTGDDDSPPLRVGGGSTDLLGGFDQGDGHRLGCLCCHSRWRDRGGHSGRSRTVHRQGRAEAGVDLGRSGVPAEDPGSGGDGTAHLPGDGGIGRGSPEVGGQVSGQVDAQTQGRCEEPGLLGGLAGAGADQLVGPVGTDDEQGDPGGVGLTDGRVEVGNSRPRGGDDGGAPAVPGQGVGTSGAQRDEAGAALIQDDSQGQGTSVGGVGEGVRQWGAARPRAQDDLANAFGQKGGHKTAGVGQGGRELRALRGVGHRSENTRAPRIRCAAIHHSSVRIRHGSSEVYSGSPATARLGSRASRCRRACRAPARCSKRVCQCLVR